MHFWTNVLVLASTIDQSLVGSMTAPPPRLGIGEMYTQIAQMAACQMEKAWPQNENFRQLLARDEQGHLIPPHFPDGQGPIGVYALLKDNPNAQSILLKCLTAMDEFCRQLMDNGNFTFGDDNEKWFYKPSPETFHICVTIFHEHPSLLVAGDDLKQRDNWKPLGNDDVRRLARSLRERVLLEQKNSNPSRTIQLELHSILWTPDGALIAGFVDKGDNDENADCFMKLRMMCANVAQETLQGPLTSRPKTLIHVTLGRILARPEELSACAFDQMKRFNQHFLPQLVQEIAGSKDYNYGRLELRQVSLIREIVWMCNEYLELATFELDAAA